MTREELEKLSTEELTSMRDGLIAKKKTESTKQGLGIFQNVGNSFLRGLATPVDKTSTDFAEKIALEDYKAGLKTTNPKIMKVGRNVVQIDPNSGAVETLIEGEPSELENIRTDMVKEQLEDKRKKQENVSQQHEASIEAIKASAQERLNTISTIKKGLKYFGPYGKTSSLITSVGGLDRTGYNDRKTWENATNRLLAQMGFDMMTELKNASRTGATGLGQLSEKEGQWLREASTELTRDISQDRAKEILDEMERIHKKVLGGGSRSGAMLEGSGQDSGDPEYQKYLQAIGG